MPSQATTGLVSPRQSTIGEVSPSDTDLGRVSPSQATAGLVTYNALAGASSVVGFDPRLGIGQLGLVPLAGTAIVVGIPTGLPGLVHPSQATAGEV